jgi:hypothetical protein
VITAGISENIDVSIQLDTTISASNRNDLPFNFGDIKVANTQTYDSPKRSGDNKASKSGSFEQCSHSLARLKDFQRDETGENFESKNNADFEKDVRRW